MPKHHKHEAESPGRQHMFCDTLGSAGAMQAGEMGLACGRADGEVLAPWPAVSEEQHNTETWWQRQILRVAQHGMHSAAPLLPMFYPSSLQ